VAEAPVAGVAAPGVVAPAVPGPVVITANDAAWIEVRDGATVLKQGELAAGQSFEVPATAKAPVLTTAKPEALRISVGTGDAPTVGPAGARVANVSLLGPDLLRGPASAPATATTAPTTTAVNEPRTTPRRAAPVRVAPAAQPAPPPVATAEPTANIL
jgi:hypothetical protein